MRKNKTVKLLIIALLGISIIPIAMHPARAQVATSGFAVTSFATGFFNSVICGIPGGGFASCGPIGIAMDASGNLYVGDIANGFVYKFGPAGGVASAATQLSTPLSLGGYSPTGLAFGKDGNLYLGLCCAVGEVVQLDPSTGAIIRTVTSNVPGATAVATDPLSGDLFVSSISGGGSSIFRISNFASGPGTVSTYATVSATDGLAFGPDGTLYAAQFGTGVVRIDGTNSTTPGATTFIASVPDIDGMAVSANPSTPFLFGNRNDGAITKVDLSTNPPTLTDIVTGGSRGDFATVGSDGCLYATQSDSVEKITNADGSCIPPPLGPLFPTNPSPTVCVAPPSGLVSWWPGEGNGNDVVGNNQGALEGGVSFASGVVGQAFNLNGADADVRVPDSPSLNPTNAISVAAWYNPTASFYGDGNNAIVDKEYTTFTSPYYQYHLSVHGDLYPSQFAGGFEFNIGNGGAATPGHFWTPGHWYYLVGTYDGSNVDIYVNGALVDSRSLTGTMTDYGKDVYIGRNGDLARTGNLNQVSDFTPGLIDEVQLFSRALTASEVQSIFNAGSFGECKSSIHVSKFFTDGSLNPLPLDSSGNTSVNVTLARGIVKSTNPGQILAWVNVTNTSGSSIQSLKLNDTLPVDWLVSPAWMPPKGSVGAIHVLYANGTSLASETDITQPSTITVSTGNPDVVHVSIPSLNATGIGHPLMPGQSILLSVKLSYGLVKTLQSFNSYPRNYTDTAIAAVWTQVSFTGTESTATSSAFFIADAKVVS